MINDKDDQLLELNKEVVRMTNANGHFQLVLDQQRKLYSMQKNETEKQLKAKEELEKELDFWLPGYLYYFKDGHLRDKLKEIIPNRRVDETSKNLEQPALFAYGDAMRLLSSINVKLPLQIKCEELQLKIDKLNALIEEFEEKEGLCK